MASSPTYMPPILMHFVERIGVLPETVVLLTVVVESVPWVPEEKRCEVTPIGDGLFRVLVHYGFMEQPEIPAALDRAVTTLGLPLEPSKATYYLGRDSLLATHAGEMGQLTESFFAFLSRNALTADRHFHIPPRQVMEIGVQIDL